VRYRRIPVRRDGGTQAGDADSGINPGLTDNVARMIRRLRDRERKVSIAILSFYSSARRFDHLTYRD
jgi:hypothetical protein